MVFNEAFRNRKYLLLAISSIAILLLVVWFQHTRVPTSYAPSEIKEPNTHLSTPQKSQPLPFNKKELEKKSELTGQKQTWNPMGDAASRAKITAWFASRGNYSFYGPDEKNEYQNYDKETLNKLSESGDIRAMHELANRAESIDESNSTLYKAAIYGSTAAITQIGTSIEIWKQIDQLPAEEKRAYVIEALAHYEAATIRGDWWGNINDGSSLKNRLSIQPDKTEQEYIKKRSQEIYDDLQKKRYELGLGEFDNTVPDEVVKLYEEMLRPL